MGGEPSRLSRHVQHRGMRHVCLARAGERAVRTLQQEGQEGGPALADSRTDADLVLT